MRSTSFQVIQSTRGSTMTVMTYRQALHDTLRAELLRPRRVGISHRRGDRRLRRLGQDHRRPVDRIRAHPGESTHRSAREGFFRCRDRRGDAGHATDRGDHDDQLQPLSGYRPDRQSRRQDARDVRRPGVGATGDPHPGRRRTAAGGYQLAEALEVWVAAARDESRHPRHPSRCQGAADRRRPRRRPGAVPRKSGAVQHQGRGSRRRADGSGSGRLRLPSREPT